MQLDNNGSAVHQEMAALAVDERAATLRHRLDWTTQQGAHVIEEHRALTVTVADETTWVLVFDTAMTNVSGETLPFGSPTTKGRDNAGYGGLFWRGPRSFTGGSWSRRSAPGATNCAAAARNGSRSGGATTRAARTPPSSSSTTGTTRGIRRSGSPGPRSSPASTPRRSSPRSSTWAIRPQSASATPSWSPPETTTSTAPPPWPFTAAKHSPDSSTPDP